MRAGVLIGAVFAAFLLLPPRASPKARRQKSEFLRIGGSVIDFCDGAPGVP